jgi:H+/Cl- antiporter ClcA
MGAKKQTVIKIIAWIGFIAKGLVYFMVGLLALQTAIGVGGKTAGTKQALEEFIYQPLGSILLIGCMIGLFSHALWKILQSIVDPENRAKSKEVLLLRVVDFFTGILYLSFSYAAWQIFQGLNIQSDSESTEVWVGRILELPFGKWLVLLIAFIIMIAGIYQFYTAYRANFDYRFDIKNMNKKERVALRKIGQIGISAWGIVYCMVGILLYKAAISFNAEEAGGLDDALNALSEQPFGIWILGITAAGLMIYGIYLLILSYYHKIYEA